MKRWKQGIIPFAILSALLIAYIIQENSKTSKLRTCPRYTIAYVTQIQARDVLYRYTMNGKDYKGFWQIEARSTEEADKAGVFTLDEEVGRSLAGQRFLVRTSCRNPDVSRAYWTYAVPDSVQFAPADGWETLPASFPRTSFDAN